MHFIMGERRENMEGEGSGGGGWSGLTLRGEPADDGKRWSRWTFWLPGLFFRIREEVQEERVRD